MNNLIFGIEYVRVPHPLEKNRYIIVGDEYQFEKTLQQIYPFYKNPNCNLPRVERKIILTEPINEENLEKEVEEYEKNLVRKIKGKIKTRVFKRWGRLGISFALSYIIWSLLWGLPWLYSAIDAGFRVVGDFLSPYAVIIMILSPSIAAIYFSLTGKNSLLRLHKRMLPLQLHLQLGKDHTSRFIKDIRQVGKNIKGKLGKEHPANEEIEKLIKRIQEKEWDKIQESLQSILDKISQDDNFPWGEKKNIKAMVEDVLYHLKGRFKFAPLKIIHPIKDDILPSEKKKATNLLEFFSSLEFSKIHQEIIQKYSFLKKASSTKERIKLADELSFLFQRMIFLSSRYHFGDFPLPYERGVILKNFYYSLFVTFGKVSYFLRKRKPDNLFSSRIIKNVEKKLKLFLNQEEKKIRDVILEFAGSSIGGILTSLGILACVMFLSGFHILSSDEFSVVCHNRFGYKGFMGQKVDVRYFSEPALFAGEKFKLFWYPPKPFAFVHNVNFKQDESFDVFMILKETEPKSLLDKFFHFFREEWGRGYSGINLRFTYKVINPELWAQYDYDGRGKERLSRDFESYISAFTEKKRGEYRKELYEKSLEELESHFNECLKEGKVSEWIRRFLYPSLLDTYRTGSMYERYLAGLRWLQDHPRMKDKPEWKEFVEHEIKNIEKLEREQNEELISRPLEVKKIINNPTISKLRRHDNLYRTITYLVVEDFINEKILQKVYESAVSKTPDPVTAGIVEWLQKECKFQDLIGIKIKGVERSVKEVSALDWQNELRKRQNLL